MEIHEYRGRLERFFEDFGRAYCRFYEGSTDSVQSRSVFSEYSDLFSPDTIRELDREISTTASFFDSRRRGLSKLKATAVACHLEAATAVLRSEISDFEARRHVNWAGRDLPLPDVDGLLAVETERDRRFALDESRKEAWSGSVSLRADLLRECERAVSRLGFGSVREAVEKTRNLELELLCGSLQAALSRGQLRYLDTLQRSLSSCPGIGNTRAEWRDLGLWVRHNSPPGGFRKEILEQSVSDTIGRLSVAPERAGSIETMASSRLTPGRAVCIAVQVPAEIRVYHAAGEGPAIFAARLHEAGHALHLAWISSSLPAEERLCGDPALHEAFAFLFEGLAADTGWLGDLGITREAGAHIRFRGLLEAFSVRMYLAKLQFQLAAPGGDADSKYREFVREWTGVEPDGRSFQFTDDLTFQSADYLRGWIAGAHLKAWLREKFGRDWYRRAAAGRLLKELWETGGRYTATEIVREVGAGNADPQLLADQLDEGLRG